MAITTEPRQRLLDAALGVFAAKGYAAASVLEISSKARVTKPTLYYYFKNKAALYQALVDHAFDQRFERLSLAASHPNEPWKKKLIRFINAMMSFAREQDNLMRLTLSAAFGPRREAPKSIKFADKAKRNLQIIESIISEGIKCGDLRDDLKPQDLAIPLYSQIFMATLATLVDEECPHTRISPERMIDLFLSGAGARK